MSKLKSLSVFALCATAVFVCVVVASAKTYAKPEPPVEKALPTISGKILLPEEVSNTSIFSHEVALTAYFPKMRKSTYPLAESKIDYHVVKPRKIKSLNYNLAFDPAIVIKPGHIYHLSVEVYGMKIDPKTKRRSRGKLIYTSKGAVQIPKLGKKSISDFNIEMKKSK